MIAHSFSAVNLAHVQEDFLMKCAKLKKILLRYRKLCGIDASSIIAAKKLVLVLKVIQLFGSFSTSSSRWVGSEPFIFCKRPAC